MRGNEKEMQEKDGTGKSIFLISKVDIELIVRFFFFHIK